LERCLSGIDIVQEVFNKISSNLESLKDEEKVHIWIYRITRNAIFDYYRKQQPSENLPLQLQAPEEEDAKELSACIRPMIESLPDKYKEALTLTEQNGMTRKQLSERLGISFSGAKSRVQRGREKLKEMLTACCHNEADRYGHIIDFRHERSTGQDCAGSCGCD